MPLISKTRPVILYADNEVGNLISFHAIFRRDYKIISASSVKEALGVLEKDRVEIIICSKYINEMSGIDFLALTLSLCPNCIRLLVSDYINQDLENKARIFDYLIKPWDEVQLGKILQEGHELFMIKELITNNFW
ncbi:response regulator [Dyadobacter frigoris]|uniref:Response regulator n=1 Tax=Dyadobacter frigoris TaxID=2576211 RepID=A0A4U6CUP0_9BACT|nr:response regulator [Dyadobacter frigoris]TKT87986.1 response regulator [Dyadobacter frigoris]GLU52885.1 hypothetical protein Dfri01_23460 [Dyadobacter frigoris]